MPVHRLDHINLRASGSAFAALRDFYCRIVGLRIGARPTLQSEGLWLYAGDAAIVHLVEAPEETGAPGDTTGSGTALDHIAFGCLDLEEMLGRLGTTGVPHSVQLQSVTGQTLVRLEDPSGLRVELVFEPALREPRMQHCWGA
ncbi:MAG: diguanylate cyclase [Proteobacteria bacterium]|nr:diguanylate cyclase [Pseudomonadota bacterium]